MLESLQLPLFFFFVFATGLIPVNKDYYYYYYYCRVLYAITACNNCRWNHSIIQQS